MILSCTALGTHQVVFAVMLVNMRGLDPVRLLMEFGTSVDYDMVGTGHKTVILNIILPHFYGAMSFPQSFARCIVVNNVGFSIIIKEK